MKKPLAVSATRKKAVNYLIAKGFAFSYHGMKKNKIAALLMEATGRIYDRNLYNSDYIIIDITKKLPSLPKTKGLPQPAKPKPLTRKEEYTIFLRSPEWKAIREQVIERANRKCQVCNSSKTLHVHHRTYKNEWGKEDLIDLIALCERCHHMFHKEPIKKTTIVRRQTATTTLIF